MTATTRAVLQWRRLRKRVWAGPRRQQRLQRCRWRMRQPTEQASSMRKPPAGVLASAPAIADALLRQAAAAIKAIDRPGCIGLDRRSINANGGSHRLRTRRPDQSPSLAATVLALAVLITPSIATTVLALAVPRSPVPRTRRPSRRPVPGIVNAGELRA